MGAIVTKPGGAPAVLKKEHRIFVDAMIAGSKPEDAYKAAYPGTKDNTARANGSKLQKKATIAAAIREGAAKIAALTQEKAAEELKDKLVTQTLTAARKRELLLKIAEGTIEIPVRKPVWDHKQEKFVFVTTLEQPDYKDRMKAIEIDNKMSGDNSPEETELEIIVTYEKKGRLKID